LSGRSIAIFGAATIKGVPALGLPKITSCVGGIVKPAFVASAAWSTRANIMRLLACSTATRRSADY
jgi:hypothetical protein